MASGCMGWCEIGTQTCKSSIRFALAVISKLVYIIIVITYSRDYPGINTLLLLSLHIKYEVMEGWGKIE